MKTLFLLVGFAFLETAAAARAADSMAAVESKDTRVASEPLEIVEQEPRIWACDFQSAALGRRMRFLVVLPEGASRTSRPLPVIYFLHGLGRNEHTLLDYATTRPRVLAARTAIVLPRGLRGWYVNSPVVPQDRFADYIDEVMRLAEQNFPVSHSPQHRAIGGWSMGGYGAMHTATRRPGDFAAVASIIGILDFPRVPISDPKQNYSVPACFGSTPEFWATVNPRLHLPALGAMKVFVAYADGAPERQMNEVFLADAARLGMRVTVKRLHGGHTFPMVEQSLDPALSFLETSVRAGGAER
jgi:S-formylglutathione hydrolase FrmB